MNLYQIEEEPASVWREKCKNINYYYGMVWFQTTIIISIILFVIIYAINYWIYMATDIKIITLNVSKYIIIIWVICMLIWFYKLNIFYLNF